MLEIVNKITASTADRRLLSAFANARPGTTLLLDFILDFELRILLYYSTLVIISEGGGEELHAACNGLEQ